MSIEAESDIHAVKLPCRVGLTKNESSRSDISAASHVFDFWEEAGP